MALLACALGLSCLPARAGAVYAFTDSACVDGKAFGPQQTCKLLGAPMVAGASATVYVTALSGGVPTRLNGAADTPVTMVFAMSCINPVSDAGKNAYYGATKLPLCAPNGAAPSNWSAPMNLLFKAGAPSTSAGASFAYADVGKVQLYLRDSANAVSGSSTFVVRPDKLAITSVTRSVDGAPNPQAPDGSGTGFARAGEAITIAVSAFTTAGDVTPNFGSEGVLLALDVQAAGDNAAKAAMVYVPQISGGFTTVVGGVFSGAAFTVDDAGILSVTPRLDANDYLGAGAPAASATTIGRFYPDHFDTTVVAALPCLPRMTCPLDVSGAVYSTQAFALTVIPRSAGNRQMQNFNGVLARQVTLAAYDRPGGATMNPSGGSMSANSIPVAAMLPNTPIVAKPVFALPQPFSQNFGAPPPVRNWTVPTPVYLRASILENVAVPGASPGTAPLTISSLRPSGTASVEGGLTVISGRLSLQNPHRLESQEMPVKAEAQYWTAGGRWETSASDISSPLNKDGILFGTCLKFSAAVCSKMGVSSKSAPPMAAGVTTFWLKAPSGNNAGSVDFKMNNPAWLPSTVSRAVFGVYKDSPVIYMREMY